MSGSSAVSPPTERATCGAAGARHSFDELCDHVAIEAAHGQVIEKEERFGAEREDVVYAVIDQVGANRGVLAGDRCNFQLGAHAIGAGDQDGFAPALHIQREEGAERADSAHYAACESARS